MKWARQYGNVPGQFVARGHDDAEWLVDGALRTWRLYFCGNFVGAFPKKAIAQEVAEHIEDRRAK